MWAPSALEIFKNGFPAPQVVITRGNIRQTTSGPHTTSLSATASNAVTCSAFCTLKVETWPTPPTEPTPTSTRSTIRPISAACEGASQNNMEMRTKMAGKSRSCGMAAMLRLKLTLPTKWERSDRRSELVEQRAANSGGTQEMVCGWLRHLARSKRWSPPRCHNDLKLPGCEDKCVSHEMPCQPKSPEEPSEYPTACAEDGLNRPGIVGGSIP